MAKTYNRPDPYALTEMEDVALAVVLDRLGILDNYKVGSVVIDAILAGDL